MSDLWVNIRFGHRHLQIKKGLKGVRLSRNQWHIDNPPKKWFQVYEFFGMV